MYNFVTLLEIGAYLSNLTLILLAAGSSSRFSRPVKKQWLRVEHDPLWLFVTNQLTKLHNFSKVILVTQEDDVTFMQNYTEHLVVAGGSTRQESLYNALKHVESEYVLVSDVARACISKELFDSIVSATDEAFDVIVPALSVNDTVTYNNTTIEREEVKRIQTPQLSRTSAIKEALTLAQNSDIEYTDESSAIVANSGRRIYVEGESDAHKITYVSDLQQLPCLKAPSNQLLVGNGFDVHAFEDNKKMYLGGVEIASTFGFKAHSDGDVAIHALIDSILGAAGMGDIGMLFPDSDMQYENIDSKILLKECISKIHNFGFEVVNADITIAAQTPRLSEYKDAMKKTLAAILDIPFSRMNVKATTTEKLGFIGRKEGVGVFATATLSYYNWKNI